MFEFEEDKVSDVVNKNMDEYDIELGIALSKSFVRPLGTQILSPETVDIMIRKKVELFSDI